MEAEGSSEMFLLIYHIPERHVPEDSRRIFPYYHDYKDSPFDLVLNKVKFNDSNPWRGLCKSRFVASINERESKLYTKMRRN
jgi:hypothetical protein